MTSWTSTGAAAAAAAAAASFLIFLSVLRSDLANWSATFSSPEEEPFFEAPLSTALKLKR